MSNFKRAYAVAAGVTVILAVGYYAFFQPPEVGSDPSHVAETRSPAAAGDAAGITAGDMAQPEFAFRRLEIDTSKPQAEACLVFARTLDTSGETRYEDYFTVAPDVPAAVRP